VIGGVEGQQAQPYWKTEVQLCPTRVGTFPPKREGPACRAICPSSSPVQPDLLRKQVKKTEDRRATKSEVLDVGVDLHYGCSEAKRPPHRRLSLRDVSLRLLSACEGGGLEGRTWAHAIARGRGWRASNPVGHFRGDGAGGMRVMGNLAEITRHTDGRPCLALAAVATQRLPHAALREAGGAGGRPEMAGRTCPSVLEQPTQH